MQDSGLSYLERRVRATNYLSVAQIFLQANFLLERPLSFEDIKARLLGHWGTCPGINFIYAGLRAFYRQNPHFQFVLGPGHGFPALQANLFVDGELERVDPSLSRDGAGLERLCKNFSFPGGFPSHASPQCPGVITEGGELGYALGAAYGAALGHPEKTVAVLIGDGEFETATTLASLNLPALIGNRSANGLVIPILHLNGYKISAPTLFARRSPRAQDSLLRGFGYTPLRLQGFDFVAFQSLLDSLEHIPAPFIIFQNEKGATGPSEIDGEKIAGNFRAHQVPLPLAKSDPKQLQLLETWLRSYRFNELFDRKRGFNL